MRSRRTAKEEEFEEIVHRFEIPLLQYARRITGDREQARDVVQETFVRFQRNGAKMSRQPGYLRFAEMQRSTFAEKRGE